MRSKKRNRFTETIPEEPHHTEELKVNDKDEVIVHNRRQV
jgi:hypothetical protein